MTLSYDEILSILPHRPPMLLIDSASALIPGQSVCTQTYIDPEWDIFVGHFPRLALLPGIYLTEIMAQAAGIMLLSLPEHKGCLPILFEVNQMRFLHPVHPGDTLRGEVTLKVASGQMHVCRARAYTGERCVARGELTMAVGAW